MNTVRGANWGEGMSPAARRAILYSGILALGVAFSYRLTRIPSRLEVCAFLIAVLLVPTLKYPRFGIFYLLSVPCFIPMFRRMFYLVSGRPSLDYLMLISDGVMLGFLASLVLFWAIHHEKVGDRLGKWVAAYSALLLVKVVAGSQVSLMEGLYGFKYNGLYVCFYFAGSYLLADPGELRRALLFCAGVLSATALYTLKQLALGVSGFERKWLDSINFTTLYIDGKLRPFGTFASPAALADAMCLLLLLGAWLWLRPRRHWRALALALWALAAAPLLYSSVRTNWMAALACFYFMFAFLRFRGPKARIANIVLFCSGLYLYTSRSDVDDDTRSTQLTRQLSVGDRSLSAVMIRNRTQALANPLKEYSLQRRMETWADIWNGALRHPFGRGQGSTGYAHSYYFQVLGEIGFPGVALFLLINAIALRRAFAALARARDPDDTALAKFLITAIFLFGILNLTGSHLNSSPGDLFYWFIIGAATRLYVSAAPGEAAPDGAAPAPLLAAPATHA